MKPWGFVHGVVNGVLVMGAAALAGATDWSGAGLLLITGALINVPIAARRVS